MKKKAWVLMSIACIAVGCCTSCKKKTKTDSVKLRANEIITDLRLFEIFGIIDSVKAQDEINQFSAIMDSTLSSGGHLGDKFGGSSTYPRHPYPFRDKIAIADLQRFFKNNNADFLIIYPVIRKGTHKIGFIYSLAKKDSSLISVFLDPSDTLTHLASKKAFKDVTQLNGGEIEEKLLGRDFYANGADFFSVHIRIDSFETWLNSRPGNPKYIHFIPGRIANPSTGKKTLTVLARIEDSRGIFVRSAKDDEYYNMTLPCPPPTGCR
ncbi:hypothetical protein [Siphonobacter aquaeclarae]|uniref:Lipoprotein n=1 Tax=Siphonobacter aquaeclarae TaxID=563176 RepID=A0A1G9R3Y3_9BACT|nr:hypothetical protein [Siphonobacter aquaeclarae]SDM17830.1 hypothetical protein SAMN04488090_2721 [Siphonobacter aquaeclarae]